MSKAPSVEIRDKHYYLTRSGEIVGPAKHILGSLDGPECWAMMSEEGWWNLDGTKEGAEDDIDTLTEDLGELSEMLDKFSSGEIVKIQPPPGERDS